MILSIIKTENNIMKIVKHKKELVINKFKIKKYGIHLSITFKFMVEESRWLQQERAGSPGAVLPSHRRPTQNVSIRGIVFWRWVWDQTGGPLMQKHLKLTQIRVTMLHCCVVCIRSDYSNLHMLSIRQCWVTLASPYIKIIINNNC